MNCPCCRQTIQNDVNERIGLNASTDSYDPVLGRLASGPIGGTTSYTIAIFGMGFCSGLGSDCRPHLPIQLLAEPYHQRQQFLYVLKRGSEIHNAGP